MTDFFGFWDWLALAWFLCLWIGFSLIADYSSMHHRSITAAVNRQRHLWMHRMLTREMKMIDTQIMGNLGNGIAFFASTSILIAGGLAATLASGAQAMTILGDLPFVSNTSVLAFEAKVLLLIGVFIYAFIKFSWSFRLSNYCSILIGASPSLAADDPNVVEQAKLPAKISGLVGMHFNRGLRSYFFALAVLPWFIHPWAFGISSTLMVAMQYRREFASRSLRYLNRHG